MKSLLLVLITLSISLNVHAGIIRGKVTHVEMGQESKLAQDAKVCVTFIKTNKKLVGIVEDYFSCKYARKYKSFIGQNVKVSSAYFEDMDELGYHDLLRRLKELNSKAEYILYDIE